MEVFRRIDPDAPLIVAEAVWQYTHHVLAGLTTHRGPILLVANWSGQWPGLVGTLNLKGSLTKAGVPFSVLWSEDLSADEGFTRKLGQWLHTGSCGHALDHVVPMEAVQIPAAMELIGTRHATRLMRDKAIMGIFDEGCMGMYNAIIPDELLHECGIFKERLSQSALLFESSRVSEEDASTVYRWYLDAGMTFDLGTNPATDLTENQILQQCKMYVAAVRLADDFGCETIGIQYQLGLTDLLPASDLIEGTLNSSSRPPVLSRDERSELFAGRAIPHFNEIDECSGIDAMMIHRIHRELGLPQETTLHDIRWGDWDQSGTTDEYAWVLEISGAAPAEHHGGWKHCRGFRQPAMYFSKGGSTLSGIAIAGEIIWSRVYVADDALCLDIGRGRAVDLPVEECRRRLDATTNVWPLMNAVTYGVSRDQLMAKHQANHIQVVYGGDPDSADHAAYARAAMARELGMRVQFCGTRKGGESW